MPPTSEFPPRRRRVSGGGGGFPLLGLVGLFIAVASLTVVWPLWFLATTHKTAYSVGLLVLLAAALAIARILRGGKRPAR